LTIGLADGRWQIIHSTSDNAVGMVDVDKLDVLFVIGGDVHNHIIAQIDIRSLADLRGRTVVLDTANSGCVYLFYAILKKNGLNLGKRWRNAEGVEALQNDKDNKAAVLNPPFSIQAVKSGLKDMGATVDMMDPY
jgi:TRAP-type uncharacterized transport system substrate-binding protein